MCRVDGQNRYAFGIGIGVDNSAEDTGNREKTAGEHTPKDISTDDSMVKEDHS